MNETTELALGTLRTYRSRAKRRMGVINFEIDADQKDRVDSILARINEHKPRDSRLVRSALIRSLIDRWILDETSRA